MIPRKSSWNKSVDLLLLIKDAGAADSQTLKRRLDIDNREFYPAIRSLINVGYIYRKKAFVGDRLYVKQFYFLTEDGEKFARSERRREEREREREGEEIQIQR